MNDAFTTTGFHTAGSRSPRTIAVDNLLRKALRVSDPRDPSQIATALLMRYPEEAERQRRERAGLPYSSIRDVPPASSAGSAVASAELVQARDDLERDLETLTTSSQLKDVRVEMIGWGRAIRQIAADGLAAARLSLDAINHDRAMSARRSLSEYARLARYVGTITDNSGGIFRRFAQSCDVLAGMILVAIGEGLAASGITRSTTMVRVAAGELQSRRNAVIVALRGLTGSVEAVLDQESWPRGLEAYRNLVHQLDASGQSDLRALLEETALASAMDELVDLSTGSNIDGLRELSTASSMLVHRFQRLIQYGQSIPVPPAVNYADGSPESPPLVTFMSALQLFVDAFANAGSTRLLYVARPPIVVYGLYGVGGPDKGARRLIDLTIARGFILEQIDCFAGCGCDAVRTPWQVLLDYLLFRIDRAIDAYAVGNSPSGRGEPERRAAAVGLLLAAAPAFKIKDGLGQDIACPYDGPVLQSLGDIGKILLRARGKKLSVQQILIRELQTAYREEEQIERLVRSLAPSCHVPLVFESSEGRSIVRGLIARVLKDEFATGVDMPPPIQMPSTVAASAASYAQGRADYWSAVQPR